MSSTQLNDSWSLWHSKKPNKEHPPKSPQLSASPAAAAEAAAVNGADKGKAPTTPDAKGARF